MKKTTKRWLSRVVVVLVCAWVGFVGYIGWAMRQPPEVFGHVMARMPMPAYFVIPFETLWSRARHGHVEPGDAAPSFAGENWMTRLRWISDRFGRTSRSSWSSGAIPDRHFGGRFPP